MSQIAIWSILVYALAVGLGGVFGYIKAKSKMSLITGSVSAAALIAAWILGMIRPTMGLILASAIAVSLVAIFIVRLVRTRKFMPAGVMMSLSFVAAVVFICGWLAIGSSLS